MLHDAGSALPPQHLQVHELEQRWLMGHACQIRQVLPQERLDTAATLDDGGRMLIWRLSSLQPLHNLSDTQR